MGAQGAITWEQAVRSLLGDPAQRQVVVDCYYDRPARDAAVRYWESPEWRAVRELLPRPPRLALDVGAGHGISSVALALDGWNVTAVEPDPSELVGRGAIDALATELALPIRAVAGTAESIPGEDSSFDVVFARQVLHHARELTAACREIYRVLRPGGSFVAIRDHVVTRHRDRPAFFAAHPLHRLYGGENAYRVDEYLSALRGAGFEVQQVLRSFDSVINFAPHTRESLRREMLQRAGRVPLAAPLLGSAIRREATLDMVLRLMSRVDHRPGRLLSIVCCKPREA